MTLVTKTNVAKVSRGCLLFSFTHSLTMMPLRAFVDGTSQETGVGLRVRLLLLFFFIRFILGFLFVCPLLSL